MWRDHHATETATLELVAKISRTPQYIGQVAVHFGLGVVGRVEAAPLEPIAKGEGPLTSGFEVLFFHRFEHLKVTGSWVHDGALRRGVRATRKPC